MRRTAAAVALLLVAAGCGGDTPSDGGGETVGQEATALATLDLIDEAADVRLLEAAFTAAGGGEQLAEGDAVRTDEAGYAAIEYVDGSVTRLDRDSSVEVVRVGEADGPDVTLRLDAGRAWHRLGDLPEGATFAVEMSVGTAAVRGTTFVTACPTEESCSVVVLDGEVEVTAADGEVVQLGPGQQLGLGPDGAAGAPQELGTPEQVLATQPWFQRNDRRDRGDDSAPPQVDGPWTTDYGTMTFGDGADGGALRATYTGQDGTLDGTLDGRVYTGTWAEPASNVACESEVRGTVHWGRFEFLFSDDGTAFDGQWSYCDAPLGGSWSGSRGEP